MTSAGHIQFEGRDWRADTEDSAGPASAMLLQWAKTNKVHQGQIIVYLYSLLVTENLLCCATGECERLR